KGQPARSTERPQENSQPREPGLGDGPSAGAKGRKNTAYGASRGYAMPKVQPRRGERIQPTAPAVGTRWHRVPTAGAVGCILSPLRGCTFGIAYPRLAP